MHRPFFALGLLCTLLVRCAAGTAVPPNIVVILADDLGYADLSCQGATTISTPRIDQLAREGVRFTSAYAAAPFCSPSRAALLTGRLPARCGLPYVLFPAERHGLPTAEVTLARALQPQGYATACIGKWHLGWEPAFRPQAHGFDLFYGVPYSNDSSEWQVGEAFMQVMGLDAFPLIDGEKIVEAPVDQTTLTRRYTERAVAFIRRNRDRPFFLYLPHTMPHVPQYVSADFAGKSGAGLYGDTVQEIDWSTGVLLDTLRELKLDEKTLVIFASDNGAPFRGGGNAAKGAPKKKAVGGGERFPGRSFVGSNAPLRGGKGTTFEGGIRVPLLIRWPGHIAPERVVAEPVSLMDIFPTAVALAGGKPPADRILDGRDLGPLLRGAQQGAAPAPPRTLYHYFGYQPQAIREGRWKLFIAIDTRPTPRPYSLWYEHQPALFESQHRLLAAPELYDLENDVGEKRNVASEHPEIVARLTAQVHDFDRSLQGDRRAMQFFAGPPPPPPHTVRTPDTDVGAYRSPVRAPAR
jgi:arylsulfatase A